MTLLGLTKECDASHQDFINNRKRLLFCVNMLSGLLKRTNNSANLLPEVVPFINSLIPVTLFLNEMWHPLFTDLCNPLLKDMIYASATESDRVHLLEFVRNPSSSAKSFEVFSSSSSFDSTSKQIAIDRKIQSFLWTLHENLFSILGLACSSLPSVVYAQSHIFLTIFNNLSHDIPRIKLRSLVKNFLKPFVQNCPRDHASMKASLAPLSSSFIPWLFKHIDDRWEVYRCNSTTELTGAEKTTTSPLSSSDDKFLENEVIEDQSNRILSREFIEVFMSLLISVPVSSSKDTTSSSSQLKPDELAAEDAEMSEIQSETNETSISESGKFLLQLNLQSWTTMIFSQLTWVDSIISLKACIICRPVLKELLSHGVISSADDVSFLLHSLFHSLKLFGENDANQSSLLNLLLMLFEGLVKKGESEAVKAPFWLLSHSDQSEWTTFEKTYLSDDRLSLKSPLKGGKGFDKKKKDAMKSLLSNVIGVSLVFRFCHSSYL